MAGPWAVPLRIVVALSCVALSCVALSCVALSCSGIYVALRFLLAEGDWPTAVQFGIPIASGLLGVLLLLGCSVCAHFGAAAFRSNDARRMRRWFAIAMLLSIGFLCVRIAEYRTATSQAFVPGIGGHRQIHDRANLRWLSSVNRALHREIKTLEQQQRSEGTHGRFESLLKLKSGLLAWTQLTVGTSGDPSQQDDALDLLAWQIDPRGFSTDESERISAIEMSNFLAASDRLNHLQQQLDRSTSQLADLQARIASNDDSEHSDRDALIEKAGLATAEITELTARINRTRQRVEALRCLQSTAPVGVRKGTGINQLLRLRLPIVVPNGNLSAWCFWLMTTVHFFAVIFVFVRTIILFWLPEKFSQEHKRVEIVAFHWHFVDICSILLFSLLYLF